MKILKIENSKKSNSIEINAIMGEIEFRQLLGYLDNL